MENFKFYTGITFLIIAILGIIALPIFLIVSLFSVGKQFDDYCTKSKEVIGKEIVLNKDTLVITDFSCTFNTYTISNGTEIDGDGINNFLLKP